MRIRKMRREDLPALAKMAVRVFREPYPKLVLSWLKASFKNRVDGACLVAEDKGKIVGAIFGEKIPTTRPNTATIREFFVAEGYRGKGIGKKLMAACLSAMKRKEMRNASLFVREGNMRALGIYRKFGFKKFRLVLLRRF
jgi:ribosomal-protein-alanine N-acetyltransferase